MKNWKFKLIRTLNLAIILEMVLLPFQGVQAQNIQDNVLNKGAQGLKLASEVLNETSRAYQQAQQLQAQRASQGLSQEEQQQLFNALRLKPRNPNDVPNIFTRPIVGDNGVVGAQRSQGRKSFDNIRQKCIIAQPRLDGTSSGLKCEELSSEDIAAEFDVSVDKLLTYNDYRWDDQIESKPRIYIQQKKTKGPVKKYVVKQGETMHSISQKMGIKLSSLYSRNKMRVGALE